MNFEEFATTQNEALTNVFTALESESIDKQSVKTQIESLVKNTNEYSKNSYVKQSGKTKALLNVLSELGYDPEAYTNPSEFVSKVKADLTAPAKQNESDQYKILESRLKSIELEKQASDQRAQDLQRQTEIQTIESRLKEAISTKLKGSKLLIKDQINSNSVKIVDGEVVFVDGDNLIPFAAGITKLINDNQDLVIADIKPGAGVGKTNSRNVTQNTVLTIEQINKLSPAEIKAHMAELKKLAGIK